MAKSQKRNVRKSSSKRTPSRSRRPFFGGIFARNKTVLLVTAMFVVSIFGFVGYQIYRGSTVEAATKRSTTAKKKSKKIKTLAKSNSEKLIKSMKSNEKKAKEKKDKKKASQKKGKISSSSSVANADRNVEIQQARDRVKESKKEKDKKKDKDNAKKSENKRKDAEKEEKKTRDDVAAAKAFQKAVVAKDQAKYRKVIADTEKKAAAARAAADKARKAESAAKKKVRDAEQRERNSAAVAAKREATANAVAAERARRAKAAAQQELDRRIAKANINEERLARDLLAITFGDIIAVSQIDTNRTANDIKKLSKIEEQAVKVQEANVALREANKKARDAKNKAAQTENIAKGLTPSGKVAPLSAGGCNDRGREWKDGKCQNTCKNGSKSISSYHNYCSGSATTTISKTQCTVELGRKWLAGIGCARKSDSGQNPCRDATEAYFGGSGTPYDYCGSRKANVAKIVPVAPQNIQKPIPANIQVSSAAAGGSGGITSKYVAGAVYDYPGAGSAGQCTDYVLVRLAQSGHDYGNIMIGNAGPLGRGGGAVVNGLVATGEWRRTNTPTVGAVVSMVSRGQPYWGHTAIVSEIHPDGTIRLEESNIKGPYATNNRTFTPTIKNGQKHYPEGITFAVLK